MLGPAPTRHAKAERSSTHSWREIGRVPMRQYGGGVMVLEPKFFKRVFLTDTENDEDLVLVSRGSAPSKLC